MLDIFLYIKLYSESMPYSGIFSTVGIFRQFQAHDSGIIQEQFTHILNITQADSGIEIWLIQAGIVSPIFRYIHKFTHNEAYLLTFEHISGNSGIFRILALPAQIMLTNTYSSSQVLLITVQIYLKHFFIFASKVYIHYFFLQDSISTITIAIIIACHQCKHTIHLTHATHVSTPPTQAHHSRHPHQHAIQERALPTLRAQACYPPHPRQRKYHAISQTLFIQKSILRILNSYQENSCGKGFQKICF